MKERDLKLVLDLIEKRGQFTDTTPDHMGVKIAQALSDGVSKHVLDTVEPYTLNSGVYQFELIGYGMVYVGHIALEWDDLVLDLFGIHTTETTDGSNTSFVMEVRSRRNKWILGLNLIETNYDALTEYKLFARRACDNIVVVMYDYEMEKRVYSATLSHDIGKSADIDKLITGNMLNTLNEYNRRRMFDVSMYAVN